MSSMKKILVSACLLGYPVRYNGSGKRITHQILSQWFDEERLVPFCPEMAAGGTVPRPPAEIVGRDGRAVLDGQAEVMDKTGQNLTRLFVTAAGMAFEVVKKNQIRIAILSDGSPSCGSTFIHDGTFSGATKTGQGVVAAFLSKNGVAVFGESQIDAALKYFRALEHA